MFGKKALLIFSFTLLAPVVRCQDFYSHVVKDHEGNDLSLETYRGKVTLVVNVASQCGYTDTTYRALKKLHDILSYGDYFSVLAFPCNQFGEQEPLDMPDIIEFVTTEYGVEFPVLDKVNVIGEDADPAFKHLIEESSVVPDWNFYKYLVDETGHIVNAWGTATTIETIFDDIQAAVEKAKKAKKSTDADKKDESNDGGKEGKDEL